MNVLILGCGDLGTRLGELLIAEGHCVTAVRRNTENLPASFDAVSFDITEAEQWKTLSLSPDVVFFTAAASARSPDNYHSTYVKGTENLIDWLNQKSIQPARLFFTSSTAVYGQKQGEVVTETSETHPLGFNGQLMLDAENTLLESTYPSCILRLSGVYGPGRLYLLNKLKAGELTMQEAPPKYTNRIHIHDAARALKFLMVQDTLEPCYLVSDSAPSSEKEVYTWLADNMQCARPTAQDKGGEQGKRCSNQRLLDSGFKLEYPSFREGYKDLIRGHLDGN